MKFESRLATRIAAGKDDKKTLKGVLTFVGIVFIVLTLTSSTLATPQAVIQFGSKNSFAKYLGQFDERANVMMVGVLSSNDWVSIKVPFKGHISDINSITFSDFVTQTGGTDGLEPFVVLKLPQGRYLVCSPGDSYSDGIWSMPYFSWQTRDTVSHGKWVVAPVDTQSMELSLGTWASVIGDRDVISVSIFIGGWAITSPYQCYVGDFSINGNTVEISNAGRTVMTTPDLPAGF